MSIRTKTFTEAKVSYGNIPTRVDFLAQKINTFHLLQKVEQKEKIIFTNPKAHSAFYHTRKFQWKRRKMSEVESMEMRFFF